MHSIPSDIVQSAAKLFALSLSPSFFSRSHQHSAGSLFECGNVLLKVSKQTSMNDMDDMDERLHYALHLRQNGITVPAYILSINKHMIESIPTDSGLYLAYAWPKAPGKPLADPHPRHLEQYYRNWAALLAACHNAAGTYRSDLLPDWHAEWQSCYNDLPDNEMKDCFEVLKGELDRRERNILNFGAIHNDAHPRNILQNGQVLTLIDFDRCCYHYFVQDIANAIYSEYSRIGFHSGHKSALIEMRELFLIPFIQAYLAAHPLPKVDIYEVEIFLLYRQFVMFSIFQREINEAAPDYLKVFRQRIMTRVPFLPFNIESLLF